MHDVTAISAYWDDELPEPEKSRLADHLATCDLCQGWVRGMAALTRTIALFPHAPVPEDFLGRVLAAIDTQAEPSGPASLGDAMRSLPGFKPKADFLSKLMAKLPVCPSFEDLSAWTDGELSAEAAADIADHLPECGVCRNKAEHLSRLSGAVQALPAPVSPSLTGMVLGLGACPSRSDLSAWLDGETGADGDVVAQHVEACADCRQYVAAARHVGAGIRTLPVPVAPRVRSVCPEPAAFVVEGELPAELASHVETCADCAARLQRWERLGAWMRLLPVPHAASGFAGRVVAAMAPACPDRLQLHAYHDGELTVAERAEVQVHAETCGDCRTVLHTFGKLSQVVSALPAAASREGFSFRVAAQLPSTKARSVFRSWQWPTAMAAGVLAVGLLVYAMQANVPGAGSQVAAVPTPAQIEQVAHVPQDHLVAVQVRSEDLLLGETTQLSSSTGLLDAWAQ
jgi:anti-sigma factor RsiW